MRLVEDEPRLSIEDLRALPGWAEATAAGVTRVEVLHPDIGVVNVTVGITSDAATFGRRWWLSCPRCGTRRRHLYLHDDGLACRKCAGVIYFAQSIPESSWRRGVANPALRAVRGLGRARMLRCSDQEASRCR